MPPGCAKPSGNVLPVEEEVLPGGLDAEDVIMLRSGATGGSTAS